MSKDKFQNLNPYITIKTIDERYELSCLIDSEGEIKTDWCWLELPEKEVWDNPDFLWDQLYNTLKSYVVDKKVTIDFEDIIQDIPVEDFELILNMLDFGIKLGFNKNGK
jgi:folate-binding Fe-S cluster repair protein YgfZ